MQDKTIGLNFTQRVQGEDTNGRRYDDHDDNDNNQRIERILSHVNANVNSNLKVNSNDDNDDHYYHSTLR